MWNRLIYLCIVITFMMAMPLQAAYLRDVPQTLVQPNGDTVQCFASGDEFYHWLHDKNDFTIVKDPSTGYWVYADKINDKLLPSSHVVGTINPATVLRPGLKISKEEIMRRVREYYAPVVPTLAPHKGTINSLCVFIRFKDQTEFPDPRSDYDDMFNSTTSGDNSVQNYFYEVSYESLTISTTSYPTCTPSTNLSYQDDTTRAYYLPFDSTTNPDGYPTDSARTVREHALLRDAVNSIAAQVPGGLNIDGDGNGSVDMITFIIRGGASGWSDLLWPHQWALFTYNAIINGARVYNYTLVLETGFRVGTMCHEMFHVLGAPDLYHYSYDGLQPVDGWDLMENNQNPPQHMGAYMKYRYGQWINSIPVRTGASWCTLNPLTSSTNNALKLLSNQSSTEYYVAEYRRRGITTFEGSIPGSGLLVYRIDTDMDGQGNRNGPPDEVYIYRPGGTTTLNGNPGLAAFSTDSERVSINNLSDPSGFLSDGSNGNLFIADVGYIGDQISFFYSPIYYELSGTVYNGHGGPLHHDPDFYPYFLVGNATTPATYTLTVQDQTTLYGHPGKKITADGTINFDSGSGWTWFLTLSGYRAGIKSKGQIHLTNGGAIKFR